MLLFFCFNLSFAITLEEAIEIAKKQASQIKLSEIEIKKAEEQIKKAKAGILPQVSLSYTYSYLGQDLALGLTSNNRHTVTFQVNQTIFDKSIFELIKLANLQREVQALLKEDVERTLEYQVKDLFYALLYRKQLISLYEQNLEYWQENYKTVEAKFNAGVVPKVELLRALSQFQQAKAQLEQAKGEYLQGLEELKSLLQLKEISDPKGTLELRQVELDEEKLFQSLLERNSTLRASKKALESAQKNLELKKAQYYPTLGGFASYQTFTGRNTEWLRGYSFGINFNYKIFDGFSRESDVALAELELLKQRENYLQLEYDLKALLKKTLISLNSITYRISAIKASLETAQEALRLSTERYKLGIADQLETLESRANYNNLLATYYLLLYQYNSALALLERLVK
ncbi:TolC family protein [Thermocrinis sp.]